MFDCTDNCWGFFQVCVFIYTEIGPFVHDSIHLLVINIMIRIQCSTNQEAGGLSLCKQYIVWSSIPDWGGVFTARKKKKTFSGERLKIISYLADGYV